MNKHSPLSSRLEDFVRSKGLYLLAYALLCLNSQTLPGRKDWSMRTNVQAALLKTGIQGLIDPNLTESIHHFSEKYRQADGQCEI